jgi:hypothetical protein
VPPDEDSRDAVNAIMTPDHVAPRGGSFRSLEDPAVRARIEAAELRIQNRSRPAASDLSDPDELDRLIHELRSRTSQGEVEDPPSGGPESLGDGLDHAAS